MTAITWTNCADEMPPDDEFMHLIVRSNDGTFTTDGHVVNEEEWSDIAKSENHKWTPYTAEKWKALTHDT